MFRDVIRAAVGAVAVGGLAVGCTTGLDGTDDASGSDLLGTQAGSAEPGRYSALPEPCGSVDEESLQELLPGGEPELYEGEPMVTFDTGRRVGCEWHVPAETTTRELTVDFERVISYDPEVSDDDQAELDFTEMAAESGVALDDEDDGSSESPADDASTLASGDHLATPVDDVGHAAYLTDEPTGDDTGVGREVTVAFRNANVIVTVTYTVATTIADDPPDSARLQDLAHSVAQQLAGDLEGA